MCIILTETFWCIDNRDMGLKFHDTVLLYTAGIRGFKCVKHALLRD